MKMFTDEKRRQYRERKNRSIIVDFFFASPEESYRLVRILISFPVGFGLAYLLWYFLLSAKHLGGGDILAEVFKWFFILSISLAFSWEPTVRSTMCLSVALVLTSQGQTLVSTYITDRLIDGPVANMVNNFEKASLSLVCNLDLAAQVAQARMQLMYEPIRDLAIDLGAGSSETERAIRNLDKIFLPVFEETEGSQETGELLKASDRLAQLIKIAERSKRREKASTKTTVAPPSSFGGQIFNVSAFLSKFQSPIAKKYAEKLNLRCEGIFNQAYKLCDEEMPDVENYCNTFLASKNWFYPIRILVCRGLRAFSLCELANSAGIRGKECHDKESVSSIVTPDFDDLLSQMGNSGRSLGSQMTVSVYFKLVEQPRILRFRAIQGIKMQLKGSIDWLRDAVAVIRLLLSILFVLLMFNGIRNCFEFTHSYLTDIRFQNVFLTKYFWKIDQRQPEGSQIQKLYKFEYKDNKLMSPWKPVPSSEDFHYMILAFFKFLIFSVIVSSVLVIDYSLYDMLYLVDTLSETTINQTGTSVLFSEVKGEGFMAKMVESLILTFNHSSSIQQNLSNEACDIHPTKLPESFYWEIGLILGLVMLLVQVFLTFVIHRVKIFWIAGFFFPRRHKARTVSLYNRLLRERILFLKLRKGKIRQMILERSLENERGFGMLKFFHRLPVLRLIFGLECMICGDKMDPKTMKTCPKPSCSLSYCPECWTVIKNLCYVCQVESGEATMTIAPIPENTGGSLETSVVEINFQSSNQPETNFPNGSQKSTADVTVEIHKRPLTGALPLLPMPPEESSSSKRSDLKLPILPYPPSPINK